MERKKVRKAVFTAAAVAALAGGTAAFAAAYRNGSQFKPSGEKQDLQANQVVFPGDESMTGNSDQETGEDSELWQKEEDSENKDRPQSDGASGYLFENGTLLPDGTESLTFSDNGNNTSLIPDLNGGTVYDVVNDASNADLVIGDKGNGGQMTDKPGNDDAGSAGTGAGTGTGVEPSQPSTPDKPSTDDPVRPSTSTEVRDPDSPKVTPSLEPGDTSYTEDMVPGTGSGTGEDKDGVYIYDNVWADNRLYTGQYVSAKDLYYALTTFVRGADGNRYLWGAEAYDKYIYVEGVSFDGGETFETEFPVQIPKDADMVIRLRYRFSTKSNQWKSQQVSYNVEDSRLFVLSEKLSSDSTQIAEDKILNSGSYEQYRTEGTSYNLYRWQGKLLGTDTYQDNLFPGWMEDGKLVPWNYTITRGRHILEPADCVPLDVRNYVKTDYYWMNNDGIVEPSGTNLCYLQTMVGVEGDLTSPWAVYTGTLEVPKYVQAVDFLWYMATTAEAVSIPDTVIYINTENDYLQVNSAWKVDKDNAYYASDDQGMLYSKDMTELLGIPRYRTKLVIPETVKKVVLTDKNNLSVVKIEADTLEQFPTIDYRNLSNCRIVVPEDLLNDFLKQNYRDVQAGDRVVTAVSEDTDETFTVKNQLIVSNYGKLRKALGGAELTRIPASVDSIGEDAFAGVSGVKGLVLSQDDTELTFCQNCFRDSEIEKIMCYTEEQYEMIRSQEEKFGKDGIEIEYIQHSLEGYLYSVSSQDEETVVTVLDAPADVKSFEGTITAQDGEKLEVQIIGDNAFEKCENLQWVLLPQYVKEIGYQAFQNCTALEGVLIDSRDMITIGNESFEGCDSLRFVASNAPHAVMKDGYDPVITDSTKSVFFFIPTQNDGYGWNVTYFTPQSDVGLYQLIDDGEHGRLLYGLSADGKNTPWILLRSSREVDKSVHLEATTEEIYNSAMAGTRAEGGAYTVNWTETAVWNMDNSAFRDSDLSGEVRIQGTLPANTCHYIGMYAFADCPGITYAYTEGEAYVSEGAFQDCRSLTKAEFGGINSMITNIFYSCNQLSEVKINSYWPGNLALFGKGAGFQFNSAWSPEEEKAHVKLTVPDYCEMSYMKAWRYIFAGYFDVGNTSAYQNMWDQVQRNKTYLDEETWEWVKPTDEEVEAEVEKELMDAENRLRKMLGLEEVTEEPTDFYPYRVDSEGMITLVGAPRSVTWTDLEGDTLGFPDGWCLDYIGTGAFKNSKGLRYIYVPQTLAGIQMDAFDGIEFSEGEQLNLIFFSDTPPELLGAYLDHPFSFGIPDENIHIMVWGEPDSYLEAWVYPLLGYENSVQLQTIVSNQMAEEGKELTEENIRAEMAKILTPAYNRLRAMMGLDEISEDDVKAQLELSGSEAETEPDTASETGEGSTEPKLPELPELPDAYTYTAEPVTPQPENPEEPADPEEQPDTEPEVSEKGEKDEASGQIKEETTEEEMQE